MTEWTLVDDGAAVLDEQGGPCRLSFRAAGGAVSLAVDDYLLRLTVDDMDAVVRGWTAWREWAAQQGRQEGGER